MPYSNQEDVETWAQISSNDLGSIGHSYVDTIAYLINSADRAIDDYCMQPDGFFNPGGVELQNEYHDGHDIGYYDLLVAYGLSTKRRPFLRLDYSPVLFITKLEKQDSNATWATLTEGRSSDYLVMETGIRFIRKVPLDDYKNVRCTYKAGYATTPGRVSECSARLAASLAHRIIDSKDRNVSSLGPMQASTPREFVGLSNPSFSDELKRLVRQYKRKVPIKLL